ncbi:MAG: hypothetical protein CMQ24_06895 [Gammaproteobacteria bacterium]|nr:hypothetical protein [Gammaproteobacteria bacterium]
MLQALKDRYPGLFVSDADERMRVYFTLRALLQCHHFAGGSARDPRPRLRALMDGTFRFPVALSGTG